MINIRGAIERLTDVKDTASDELRVCCPWCSDYKYHLYVNSKSGKWKCQRCSEKGRVQRLVEALGGDKHDVDMVPDALPRKKFSKEDIKNMLFGKSLEEELYSKAIKQPRDIRKISPGGRDKHVHAYLRKRGFSVEDVLFYHLKVTDDGKWLYVPFYENGKLVYYQRREIDGPGKMNPPKDGDTAGKSFYIFNYDGASRSAGPVVIVEGWADAITVGRNAVSIQGKSMSDVQAQKIVRICGAHEYVIFLDPNDDTSKQQYEAAEKIGAFDLGARIRIVNAFGKVKGDPNDLGRAKCAEIVERMSLPVYAYRLSVLKTL